MYNPPAFREDRPEVLHQAIRDARLGMLVTADAQGLQVSHIPMLLDASQGSHGALVGHLARANPQWRSRADHALAVFTGPDAYVSPSLYPSKREHGRVVPTWNYVAVHAHGRLRVIEDAEALHALVSGLTRHHEADKPRPWGTGDAPADFIAAQLRGIVGVVLEITRLEGKWKMSQNRSPADRQGVAEGLADSDDAAARAVAALVGST